MALRVEAALAAGACTAMDQLSSRTQSEAMYANVRAVGEVVMMQAGWDAAGRTPSLQFAADTTAGCGDEGEVVGGGDGNINTAVRMRWLSRWALGRSDRVRGLGLGRPK